MISAPSDSPTRLRLLEAAAALMLEKGFSGTSVDSVCARAGLTKGCLIASFSQELQGLPSVRRSCRKGFEDWVEQLAVQIALAKERHAPNSVFDPVESAEGFIAHVEGAILIAKASDDAGPVVRAAKTFKRGLKAALAS